MTLDQTLINNINKADSASENELSRNYSGFYGNKKVISIWIFAEDLTRRKNAISEIFPSFKGNKDDKLEVVTENKRIIIFELNKYQTTNENFKDLLTNLVNFLQKPEYLENNPLKIKNKELDKAIEKLEYMSKKDEERHIIQSIDDYERDRASEKYWEGVEGEKIGKEEGKKEKSIEIAKNMLKEGLDVNLISKLSGLTIDEINNLKE